MNKVIMIGRLTADPEIRYSAGANQTCIANFSIAVDRKFKREGEPEADFFYCTEFGKGAEFAEKWFKKGIKVVVEGRLQNDSYTNKDGQKVTTTKIIVEAQEFAESKSSSTQANNVPSNDGKSVNGKNTKSGDGFMNIPEGIDEELPFA